MKGVAAEFGVNRLRATTAYGDILGRFIPRSKGLSAALLPSGGLA
jgi:hypothetical protein